jgi:hypothetical protein
MSKRLSALLPALLLAACAGNTPSTPVASTAQLPASRPPTSSPVVSVPATAGPSALPSAPVEPPSGPPSANPATVEPGSSLDPAASDAGVAGRLTIVDDTRGDRSGTHEIIGLAADGSGCSFSLTGDEFSAAAWFDGAPAGMLHQMALTIPTDTVPVNDGELRMAIPDGRFYSDFVSDSGFGTEYSSDPGQQGGGTLKVDARRSGNSLTLSFNGTTWDEIEFSGQMICSGLDP